MPPVACSARATSGADRCAKSCERCSTKWKPALSSNRRTKRSRSRYSIALWSTLANEADPASSEHVRRHRRSACAQCSPMDRSGQPRDERSNAIGPSREGRSRAELGQHDGGVDPLVPPAHRQSLRRSTRAAPLARIVQIIAFGVEDYTGSSVPLGKVDGLVDNDSSVHDVRLRAAHARNVPPPNMPAKVIERPRPMTRAMSSSALRALAAAPAGRPILRSRSPSTILRPPRSKASVSSLAATATGSTVRDARHTAWRAAALLREIPRLSRALA